MASVVEILSPVQRGFVTATSKRRAGIAGRRGGKSVAVLAWLVLCAASAPTGTLSCYTAVSVGRAKEILTPAVSVLRREAGIDLQWKTVEGLKYLVCPNDHRIWVAGCPNRGAIDSFRGSPLVAWAGDESASLDPYLQELFEEAVEPALLDHDGSACLTGTPGAVPVGYWYGVTTGDGAAQWPTTHWTVLDNPALPHASRWLEQKRIDNGWTDETPVYAREYLGRWAVDLSSLCYPYDLQRNGYSDAERPTAGEWRCAIAADLGVVDDSALVLLRWRLKDPRIWIDDAFTRPGMSPSALGAKVLEWRQRYRPSMVVADTGGIGKAYTTEWAERYGIGVTPARKVDAAGQIAIVAGEMQSGQILVHTGRCRDLIDQWRTITWDERRRNHAEQYADHLAAAARYGCMAVRATYRPELEHPQPGTEEWARWQDAKEREELFRKAGQAQVAKQLEFERKYGRLA